jgi:hypothetical protein
VLEAMWDESISLCLTPQAFSNINPGADIFNNINQQFWQYVLPGCDALGYIACTGMSCKLPHHNKFLHSTCVVHSI